jgi:shikimate 5-dehydrogenase
VVDLVYNPWRTRFLRRAAAAGARTLNGWPMLVRQAAAALDLGAGPGEGDRLVAVAQRVERRDPAGE